VASQIPEGAIHDTEKEIKTLMAVIMQNSLMIQQLQLMVVVKQKEIGEEESREESR